MPELPEVETTRRGIQPHIQTQRIDGIVVRQPQLRWPIPTGLETRVTGQTLRSVQRRAKYLLLGMDSGTLILHLGMSGSLRLTTHETAPGPHDHFDLLFHNGVVLRLRDPRRFGAVLWTTEPDRHRLLCNLGLEPLDEQFRGDYLYRMAQTRRLAVKSFIMDSHLVVGIGNIYASESLFRAGIHPQRPCNRIALPRYQRLADEIKEVLTEAIRQGGTTLRDFFQGDGKPGYFALKLQVYGREGEPCPVCGSLIRQRRIGQRSSFFCPRCQH